MRYGTIHGIEQPVSKIVLGSMFCNPADMDRTRAVLNAFIEAGGNCIDTAHIYGAGNSERAIGLWLADRDDREKIVILDKGCHPDNEGARVHASAIRQDLAESLDRLQSPYIDIYLLHRDDPSTPVGEIVEALAEAWEEGKIRAYGGSNWSHERIEEANQYAVAHGLAPFSVSSPHFSLAVQNGTAWNGCIALDRAAWEWHRERQFPLFPWSSQAAGLFTGRYKPGDEAGDIGRIYFSDENWARLERARTLGSTKGCSANNIALAYVLNQPFPVHALIGPVQVSELTESLRALDVSLSPEEMAFLEGHAVDALGPAK